MFHNNNTFNLAYTFTDKEDEAEKQSSINVFKQLCSSQSRKNDLTTNGTLKGKPATGD